MFPRNWDSLDHLDPALTRRLAVGDIIPNGEPGTAWYVVAEVEAPHTLVLHSTTHVPPAWRKHLAASIAWTWAFRLNPVATNGTRLQPAVRGRTGPWWLTATYHAVLVPADFIMALGMLRGIKRRAESAPTARRSGRAPFSAPAGDAPPTS